MSLTRYISGFLLAFLCGFLATVFAESSDSFSLTITPPLFQLSMSGGESWSSQIKVVNNNPYSIDVYTSPVNFEAQGEDGIGRFIPTTKTATTSYSLASWFLVDESPVHILPEKTGYIPFTLSIPLGAEPGGHYGALLIGNQPSVATGANVVNVSASISSLFLVKINGLMNEKGDIREFSLDHDFYQEPKVKFTLRFENKGNVHLLPRGEILIKNMWGKERGKILVNQDTDFGNVLPQSIRNFQFIWTGEDNFYEIGRYTALATLSFGDQKKATVYRENSFWVIPIVPAIKIFLFIISFIFFVSFAIKRYIRKALMLESQRLGIPERKREEPSNVSQNMKIETLVRPLAVGAVDLRTVMSKKSIEPVHHTHITIKESLTLGEFITKYRIFIISITIIIFGLYSVHLYFQEVLTYHRDFDVQIQREDGKIMKTSPSTNIKTDDIKLK